MPKLHRLSAFLLVALTLIGCASHPTQAPAASPAYRLVKGVPLGAPDRWASVVFDATSKRVYVAHGDRVTVLDGASDTVIGNVEGFAGGTHGVRDRACQLMPRQGAGKSCRSK